MDKGFNASFIEELKLKNDIVSVIGKYSNLQKKGKTWWTCCPFHFEKTPSFAVNEYEQYYKCFGCGASGDVIKFIEKIESCDFIDACKILAKNANMEMPNFSNNENIALLKKQKDLCFKILKATAKHYYSNLKKPAAKIALDYLDKRGVNFETIKTFGLGYSLGWDNIIAHLKELGFNEVDIERAGVIEKKNGKYYDAIAKRLVFPIINSYGDVVGFSARMLEKADFAKYKNTSQTLIFDKSKCVYNINQIKKQKQNGTLNFIIIVEGQMDVISLHKAGIENCVACMGTALTAFHAKEMKKYSDKVIVCFDSDNAGIMATLRSLEILVNNGLDVYVASLSKGMDPDEFINKYGKVQFDIQINKSLYWVEFLIRYYAKMYNLNKMEEKTRFINDCLNVIKDLKTESEKDIYLNIVKDISNVSTQVLKIDLININNKKIEIEKIDKSDNGEQINTKENAYAKAVKFVIAALLHKKEYTNFDNEISQFLLNPDYAILFNYLEELKNKNEKPIISSIFNMFDVDNNNDIYDIINYNFNENKDNKQYFNDCVNTIKKFGFKMIKADLTKKITATADLDERKKLAEKLQKVIQEELNQKKN